MTELLAPAGNWESLTAAVKAGCNSVYFGVKGLNMRANARNFELGELKKVCDFCHSNNVRCYLCVNTITYDEEFEKIRKILDAAKEAKIDAIICWDMGVVNLVREYDAFEVHLSTQASVSNIEALKFYSKFVDRFILARELSLEQIKQIKEKIIKESIKGPKGELIKIECFAHGAMCVAVSGRCFTSQFLYGRSANRGDCIQPCRRSFKVTDTEEPDKELELDNNYVMSPKDLCTIEFIDKLIDAGIDALKIEGRSRSVDYVDVVVSSYRKAIDAVEKGGYTDEMKQKLKERLKTVYNRKFSDGFYMGKPINEWAGIYGSNSKATKEYVGVVRNYYPKIGVAEIKIEAKSLAKGDNIMITGNATGILKQSVEEMQKNHKDIEESNKGDIIAIKVKEKVRKNDKVFIIEASPESKEEFKKDYGDWPLPKVKQLWGLWKKDLSMQEIADEMGIPVRHVKYKLHKIHSNVLEKGEADIVKKRKK
ncbi:U32 family peptidase [Candidatus Woesearchaeota archaeon]|nr:U32 family peptidase [Candidatus Woesearchaeota archaeon]